MLTALWSQFWHCLIRGLHPREFGRHDMVFYTVRMWGWPVSVASIECGCGKVFWVK